MMSLYVVIRDSLLPIGCFMHFTFVMCMLLFEEEEEEEEELLLFVFNHMLCRININALLNNRSLFFKYFLFD